MLSPNMATRFDIERAVLASDLAPGCRHLMHVLCVRFNAAAGAIPPQNQPSLTELARDTGRDRRSVMRYLNVLERAGWVDRDRAPVELARREHRRTYYALRIPGARDTTAPGLGTDRPGARDTAALGLGASRLEARDTVPHKTKETRKPAGDLAVIIEAIQARTGKTVDEEWAGRVREQIIGARDIRHSGAYLRRVITAAAPETYVPTPQPPPYRRPAREGQPA